MVFTSPEMLYFVGVSKKILHNSPSFVIDEDSGTGILF